MHAKDDKKPERIIVEIFGDSYPLRTDEPARLQQLASIVDQTMKDTARTINSFDGRKIAVFSALKLADAYDKLKKDYEKLVALLNEK